jgi:hypothetical protein
MTTREKYYCTIEKFNFGEWIYYCFALPTAFSGPPCEYRDHEDWLYLKGAFGKMKPGAHIMPALKRYGQAILLIIFNITASQFINTDMMMAPEFKEHSLPYKLGFNIIHCQIILTKLYLAFFMMESYCIASGLGYSITEGGAEEFNTIKNGNLSAY